MLREHTTSSPTKKCMRSSMALQVNSMGRVDIQVKTIRVEQDRQSVILELRYGRHGTDFNCATTWWRTLWRDSEPHETHFVKIYASADPQGHGRNSEATAALFMKLSTPNRAGGRCDMPTPKQSPVSRSCYLTKEIREKWCRSWD